MLSSNNRTIDGVEITDDFLTPEELEKCAEAVSRPAWKFGQVSQSSPISTPFWMMTLTDDVFFNTQLLSKIQSKTGKNFTLQRVYANGQTFGQDGTYHQDDASDDGYTFCIYINKQITHETIDNIGGEFVFKLPDSEKKTFSRIVVEPIYNRGILFPSKFFHKGLAFNRYNKGLRISIAWKLKLIIE
jgi:hypothetical protein